jgi:CheY-like chemotaxis protein
LLVKTKTVLIVEDDEEIRGSLEDALTDDGYVVVSAANGQQALERLPTLQRPCAIVLDLILPIMGGAEFYEVMRRDARFAEIPVLVSTSDPSRAPAGLITMKKPINLGQFLATIRSFFKEEEPPNGSDDGAKTTHLSKAMGGDIDPSRRDKLATDTPVSERRWPDAICANPGAFEIQGMGELNLEVRLPDDEALRGIQSRRHRARPMMRALL